MNSAICFAIVIPFSKKSNCNKCRLLVSSGLNAVKENFNRRIPADGLNKHNPTHLVIEKNFFSAEGSICTLQIAHGQQIFHSI